MRAFLASAFGLGCLLACSRASAADPAAWHVAAGAGTDFPLALGARADVEAPFRLRASTSIGVLPGPYVDAINGFVVAIGGYDQSTADLVKAALSASLVWRTHLGYRPFEHLGLYGEAGYGLVALGGSASASEVVAAATGREVPPGEATGSRAFDITSTLHMVDVELGWELALHERLRLRTAIGGAFTVASSTRIEPTYTPRSPRAVSELARAGEAYLDDTYTSYVMSPVASVSLSYVFF